MLHRVLELSVRSNVSASLSWRVTIVCIDSRCSQDDKQVESLGGHKVTDYLRLDKTKDRAYFFDHAISPEISQLDTFAITTGKLVPEVLQGRNACCFAYGATGSGKTFTMTGTSEFPGLIPLAVDALFENAGAGTEIMMQYVEIYNEQIKDLLQPANGNLDVREAPGRGTYVAGAANVEVASCSEVESLLEAGNAYRTTESTQLNMVSSRSHAVLQLRCCVKGSTAFGESGGAASASASASASGGGSRGRYGKLSLIDLAGSERASKTGVMYSGGIGRGGTSNNSKRLNEGANINKSLLALANCISALADQAKKGSTPGAAHAGHVPYRDSKLTRLLKDSLGGACRTMMIANVSPASDQFDETLNTLKYADRAKRIRTKEHQSPRKHNSRRLLLGASGKSAGAAAAAAARRAAERAEASQLTGAKEAQERHLQRMDKGRMEQLKARGIKRQQSSEAPVARLTRQETAAITLQKHARGRLGRTGTVRFKAGDLLGGAKPAEAARNRAALAKRAALANAQMYDRQPRPPQAQQPRPPPPRPAVKDGQSAKPAAGGGASAVRSTRGNAAAAAAAGIGVGPRTARGAAAAAAAGGRNGQAGGASSTKHLNGSVAVVSSPSATMSATNNSAASTSTPVPVQAQGE
jgi:hypothetical protein